jgi:hypothetical protein
MVNLDNCTTQMVLIAVRDGKPPHPKYPDRLVRIMAGNHAIGTGATCLAVTHSPLIFGHHATPQSPYPRMGNSMQPVAMDRKSI